MTQLSEFELYLIQCECRNATRLLEDIAERRYHQDGLGETLTYVSHNDSDLYMVWRKIVQATSKLKIMRQELGGDTDE